MMTRTTLLNGGKRLAAVVTALNRTKPVSLQQCQRCASGGVTAVKHNEQFPTCPTNVPDLNQQSIVLPGPERIRVCSYINDSCYKPHQFFSDAATLYEAFQRGQRVSNDGPFLGARTGPNRSYEWLTFSQVDEQSRLLGSGFIAQGNKPGDCIGIFAQNRPEWTITDIACMQYSLISVPLYNSMGWKACQYIVNKTKMSTLVLDTVEKALLIADHADSMPTLNRVVVMSLPEEGSSEVKHRFVAAGIELCTFDEVMTVGAQNIADQVLPTPDVVNTICFTSGTTGVPKGVPLTHKNHIANHACAFATFQDHEIFNVTDTALSLLPIAHVYERGNIYNVMAQGTRIGYYSGDLLKIVEDAQELQPTVFTAVPRLYNRLYDRIKTTVDGGNPIKRAIFYKAYAQKLKDLEQGNLRKDTVWDKLVFKKIQDILGGNVRTLLTGGAPISGEVITFIRCVFGCSFVQAYGQTETTNLISHTLLTDTTNGHVGPPGGGMAIKLVDVPELNYLAENDQGEICVKAANVFDGYLDNPEETAETIDKDGWMHTGDIGEWTETGVLKLIDRKKHIFKMAQGVYVAPEKVENTYVRNYLVMQVFVYGDSTKANCVGIVVPDPEAFPPFAAKHGVTGSLEEICQNLKAREVLRDLLVDYGSKKGLLGFEQMRDIRLHHEPFTEDNGFLTPSLKIKRPEVISAFRNEIDEMYANLD